MTEISESTKQSCLYDKHIALGAKSRLAPFASYLMPLWYSSISQEHQAVRKTAGLFDCTHMGVLQVQGPEAKAFLEATTPNKVANLKIGAAQYSFFLDHQGRVLDDIIIYKRSESVFMVVVNAANEAKIKAWLITLLADDTIAAKPEILDLRDTSVGAEGLVDIALQGPASRELLASLLDDQSKEALEELKPFHFIETKINGIITILSRTGYTGAKMGFEIFVHPDQVGTIWDLLLKQGASPCGLGARDSLRIEAGLPLYGHELAGHFNLSPYEAGYGGAIKLNKETFIGQTEIKKSAKHLTTPVPEFNLRENEASVRSEKTTLYLMNKAFASVG
jgi:glycine cleavage system T protein